MIWALCSSRSLNHVLRMKCWHSIGAPLVLFVNFLGQDMSKQSVLAAEDDPDTYLVESSVPDVRAFEQKTR